MNGLYQSVRKIIEQGRKAVSDAANAMLIRQNWAIYVAGTDPLEIPD